MKLTEALEAGAAELIWDGYTVFVHSTDGGAAPFRVFYCVGALPPHAQAEHKTLEEVWEDLANSFLPDEVARGDSWEPVTEEE